MSGLGQDLRPMYPLRAKVGASVKGISLCQICTVLTYRQKVLICSNIETDQYLNCVSVSFSEWDFWPNSP